jgi:hypothetical protein
MFSGDVMYRIIHETKANIQFVINNNSCELKVHSKNKCLKVSASLQTTHLCVLEILYINIKI